MKLRLKLCNCVYLCKLCVFERSFPETGLLCGITIKCLTTKTQTNLHMLLHSMQKPVTEFTFLNLYFVCNFLHHCVSFIALKSGVNTVRA